MDNHALAQLRAQMLNEAIKRNLLPRGTNSSIKREVEVSKKIPKLVDVNKSRPAYHYNNGLTNSAQAHSAFKSSTMKRDLVKLANHYQSIRGQSEGVEQHMNLTKPTRQMYPETIKAPDRADNWTRPEPLVDVNKYLRDLRKAYDND